MKTQTNSGMLRAGNKAGDFGRRRWPAWLALLVWFGCGLVRPAESAASICASVKIEIQQSMTLERQAFVTALRQYLQVLAGAATLEGVELDGAATPLVQ